MTPLTHPAKKNLPGRQKDQGHGVVLHVQEEVYQSTLTFRRRVASSQGLRMMPLIHPAKNFDLLV